MAHLGFYAEIRPKWILEDIWPLNQLSKNALKLINLGFGVFYFGKRYIIGTVFSHLTI